MKNRGIDKVRPLFGGFDAWRELGFPLHEHLEEDAVAASESKVDDENSAKTEETTAKSPDQENETLEDDLACEVCKFSEADEAEKDFTEEKPLPPLETPPQTPS